MTLRGRRLLTGIGLVVVALFVGRWLADFLAERWWAATISPAAVAAVTRWRLLGLGLNVFAVVAGAAWFALHAVVVARAIASVQVARQVGSYQFRETVPARLLLFAAIATGMVLGLVTGAGAREWRAPVALAWQGVHYGIIAPLLRVDLGVFVSQLPVWDRALGFATLLVVLGLGFVALLYLSIGAVRRENGELVVHPYARRHLGALLAVLAVVVSVGYLLAPYHFLTTTSFPISTSGALTRIRSTQMMAGVALGIGVLSLLWVRHGRHALLVGGWSVLAIAAVVERLVVPALTAEASAPAGSDAVLRRFDALAWGISETPSGTVSTRDSVPEVSAIWDEGLLARFAVGSGGRLLAATQSALETTPGATPVWLVATSPEEDSTRLNVAAIQEGVTSSGGLPVSLQPENATATRLGWRNLADARLIPNGPTWRVVPSGVSADGLFRRVILAWSRQRGHLLVLGSGAKVDWHLDPSERAAALLPMASWLPADVMILEGRPIWVVQGVLPLDRFPLATRSPWRGEAMGGVVAGFIATMDPATGVTKLYLDPGADSTAVAWSRCFPGLIQSAAAIPLELRENLPYPATWLDAQLQVLEAPEWGLGRQSGRALVNGTPSRPVPVWRSPSEPGHQSAFEDPARQTLSALVTARRANGIPSIRIERNEDIPSSLESAGELVRLWGKSLPLMHVRDSTRAAGDSAVSGSFHWLLGGHVLAAWQPVFALSGRGTPVLLWVATSLGSAVGGGRTAAEAWSSVRPLRGSSASAARPGDAAIIAEARLWMLRADSALARGDLTAFGRAIEELRAVLKP